ncbi:hypothetical protein B0T16DRAFT_383791 [Cercophora newfieldiana]|uniref:Uncharacterized protein n=1 Tax=Cercophora newfieldiana TaxID=92897 RepID=A0AA40CZG0_9PEZI|nr:hypothetical protein B0T16DRAFT_383791 [Cercophora newfieldiana]
MPATFEATYRVTATRGGKDTFWVPVASSIVGTATGKPAPPQPAATSVATITNARGEGIATVSGAYLETLIGPDGVPKTITAYRETATNAQGIPTATHTRYLAPTFSPPNFKPSKKPVYVMSEGIYFIGLFLPTLIATLLAIPVQIFDTNLKLMLPFFALTRQKGSSAKDSLCLDPCKPTAPLHSLRLLFLFGDVFPVLSDLLVLTSTLLTSIASEAIGFKLLGQCSKSRLRGCVMTLWIFDAPFRVAETLLILMAMLIIAIWVLLRRKRSGVAVDPWNVAVVASLLSSPEMRSLLHEIRPQQEMGDIRDSRVRHALRKSTSFSLGWHHSKCGDLQYGIIPKQTNDIDKGKTHSRLQKLDDRLQPLKDKKTEATEKYQRLFSRRLWNHIAHIGFFLLVCGFFIVILYYETTTLDTAFERFFDNEGFGIRFIFAGLGAVISLFWEGHFSRTTRIDPYRHHRSSGRAEKAMLLTSPATTPYTGLWIAIRQRNWLVAAVALLAILSKFMPIMLSNIPFRNVQTWTTHLICASMSLVILFLMMVVLVWSFWTEAGSGRQQQATGKYVNMGNGI